MIGKNVFRIRIDKKLSRNELAMKVGVSQQFIQQLEKGKKNPSINTAKKLACALGCTIDELLSENKNLPDIAGKSN